MPATPRFQAARSPPANVATGARFEAITGVNGGYTIKVPEGTYKLDVEVLSSEVVTKQPAETHVNKSDLDPKRDFTIAVKAPSRPNPLNDSARNAV